MQPLDRLLRPRSIAVIGGGAWCANIVRQCGTIGFEGAVWPVHPTKAEVGGLPAVPRLSDLPGAPDATFIGVNREATVGMVAELAGMGAGGAVCFAAGFREALAELADGADLQDRLVAAAGDMRILGPNCYGFLNYLDGAALWPDQHGGQREATGVAIVTQSSNIAINLTMQRRGLPLAYAVTAGNQAQTGLSEIGTTLLEDPRVTALGLHIEGIDDLAAFARMATTAARLGKRIVALKVGASEQAQVATVSHTASLAGSDAGARALFERLGIVQVGSLSVLLETLKLLHVAGPLRTGRIASLSCSGGEASLMADRALGTRLSYPPLTDAQKTGLRAALGPKVALANPLDYHTYIWGDQDALTRTFTAAADPGLDLLCVVLDFPRADRCTSPEWQYVVNALRATRDATGVQVALIGSIPENLPEDEARRAIDLGIVPFCGMDEALEAMSAAVMPDRPSSPPPLVAELPADPRLLAEAEAKAALAGFGLAVPRMVRVGGAAGAAEAAEAIGYPVVLKGEGFAHKTEAGAVVIGLSDADAVARAAAAMPAPSFLIEEQVTGAVAELLVGVVCDPASGHVLTLGAGGTLTELMRDRVSLLLPVTATDIRAALERLRIAPVLQGYRGKPGANLDAIAEAVLAVQAYVAAHPGQIDEVEINPLICTPERAVAVDALVRKGDPT
ncbi:acetate--CoA ligase family protein [Palleronia sp. KMU-117]|uniref:acetate--CoA ligase family protein n=1 Tax=Palleronia sp. KMU-117 TaxID=3434108 RepID=UPI003D76276C